MMRVIRKHLERNLAAQQLVLNKFGHSSLTIFPLFGKFQANGDGHVSMTELHDVFVSGAISETDAGSRDLPTSSCGLRSAVPDVLLQQIGLIGGGSAGMSERRYLLLAPL